MSRNFTKEQLEKLPKWAKDIITRMEVDLRDLREYKTTKENTKIVSPHFAKAYQHGPFEEIKYYLPPYSQLVARLEKTGFEVSMNVEHDHGNYIRLDIGDGIITPSARNVVHIWPIHNKHTREDLYKPVGNFSQTP